MAVPFNMPEDQTEVNIDVLIQQIIILLRQIQAIHNRPQDISSNISQTRVRVNRRTREESNTASTSTANQTNSADLAAMSTPESTPASFPDLLNNLAWLQEEATTSSHLTAVRGQPRRRTTSESSCCDETKISITAIVNTDWTQVGVILRHHADDSNSIYKGETTASHQSKCGSSEGLLTSLVPNSMSGPMWTAMICFVGWHLFKAR